MHGRLSLDGTIPLQAAYQLIDEAIRKHETCIESTRKYRENDAINIVTRRPHLASVIALKSQRNELGYASRLPPEVLCRIFAYAQRDECDRMLFYSDWTAITHVSRYWRNVALDASSLWREPMFGSIRWLREVVKRSKQIGFIVNISGEEKHHRRAFQFALEHASRIVGLRIRDNARQDCWKRIRRAIILSESAAATLEFLEMELIDYYLYPVTFRKMSKLDPPSIPLKDLPGVQFRLRTVQLDRCGLDWRLPVYFQKALTHLTIEDPPQKSRPTLKNFINALKEVPDLQYLQLKSTFPVAAETSSLSNADRLHFAHLRVLRVFSGVALEVESFFRLITFTPDASVSIGSPQDKFSKADISGILSALASSYSTKLGIPTFQTLTMTQFENSFDNTLRVRFFSAAWSYGRTIYEAFEIDGIIDNLNLKLEFEFVWEKQSESSASPLVAKTIIDAIFGSNVVPLHDVQNVYLNLLEEVQKEINSEMLINTFGKLPQVFSFVTQDYSSRPFVNALELSLNAQDAASADTSNADHADKKLLYFPKLATLCFYETMIVEAESEPDPTALPLKLLNRCLERRNQYGARIYMVNFAECIGRPGVGALAMDGFDHTLYNSRPYN